MKLSGFGVAPICGVGAVLKRFSTCTANWRSQEESEADLMMKAMAVVTDNMTKKSKNQRLMKTKTAVECFAIASRV